MSALILYFIPYYLRLWGILLPVSAAGLFIGSRIGVSEKDITVIPILLRFGGLVGAMYFQKNISWIKSLPVSKARIFLAATAVSVLNLALTALCVILCGKFIKFIFPTGSAVADSPRETGISTFRGEFILILYVLLGIFAITVLRPATALNPRDSKFARLPFREKSKWIAAFFGASAILHLCDSTFLNELALGAFFWGAFFVSVSTDLALYPAIKRKLLIWLSAFTCLAAGAGLFVTQRNLNDSNPEVVLDASSFLGGVGSEIPEEKLGKILDETQDMMAIQRATSRSSGILERINLETWLTTRTNPKLLNALSGHLKRDSLGTEEVRRVLAHFREIDMPPEEATLVQFTLFPFERKETLELVASKHAFDRGLGLFLCRRFVERDCVPLIEEDLKKPAGSTETDKFLDSASKTTLSILYARYLPTDFFEKLQEGRPVPGRGQFSNPDCSNFQAEDDLTNLYAADAGPLNYCVRKLALEKFPERPLREMGWITGDAGRYKKLFSGGKKHQR